MLPSSWSPTRVLQSLGAATWKSVVAVVNALTPDILKRFVQPSYRMLTSLIDDDMTSPPFQGAPSGLINFGNNCFINAIVQCLRVVPGFIDELEHAITKAEQALDKSSKDDHAEETNQLNAAYALVDLLYGISGDEDEDLISEEDAYMIPYDHFDTNQRQFKEKRDENREKLIQMLEALSKCTYLVCTMEEEQEQQDAEEFLSFLLDMLSDLFKTKTQQTTPSDVTPVVACSKEEDVMEKEYRDQLARCHSHNAIGYIPIVRKLGDISWMKYVRQNDSFITRLFAGQIVRGSKCMSCSYLSSLHQEFRLCTLSIDSSKSETTLTDCLQAVHSVEQLSDDNKVFCDGYCKMKTKRSTQELFQRAPNTLIFQLQRFQQLDWGGGVDKIETSVTFPIDNPPLDISSNMFMQEDGNRLQYQLTAVCAHIGASIDAGHYIAYVRHDLADGPRWLKIDDDVVHVIDTWTLEHEAMTTAYLLFYKAVSERTENDA